MLERIQFWSITLTTMVYEFGQLSNKTKPKVSHDTFNEFAKNLDQNCKIRNHRYGLSLEKLKCFQKMHILGNSTGSLGRRFRQVTQRISQVVTVFKRNTKN